MNFSGGYAPGISTNLPVFLSIITLPGVPETPNNCLHSLDWLFTSSVYLPSSIHFSISFLFNQTLSAISSSESTFIFHSYAKASSIRLKYSFSVPNSHAQTIPSHNFAAAPCTIKFLKTAFTSVGYSSKTEFIVP